MKSKHIRIGSFLLMAFMYVVLAVKIMKIDDVVANICMATAGLLCFSFYLLVGNKQIRYKAIVFGFLLSIFMLCSSLYNGNASLSNILWIWSFLGVALILYDYGIKRIYAYFVFLSFALLFIYRFFVFGMDVEDLLHTGSVNNISTICILSASVYYIAKFQENRKDSIDYIPILLIAILSVLTATRSALIVLGIFFIYAVLYNFHVSKNKSTLLVLLFALIGVVFLYINYFDEFGGALEAKAERYGMESVRTEIWKDYMRGLTDSIGNFIFGVPGNDVSYKYLSEYTGNTHNAFLMLHSKYGIGGFCFFIYFLFRALRKTIRKKDFLLTGVLLLVSMRSLFDWTAFPGVLDVIFWFFVFYVIENHKYNLNCI